MRDKEKPIELVGGLQQYELEATFIEDAATLRKFTYPEFAQLRMQLIDLRKKLQHETDEKKQFVLMHWLYNVQKFATPDLVLTFLMQVHYVVEKRMMFDHADKILKWHRCVPTQLQAFIGGWPMRGGNKAIPPVTRQKFTKKEEIKVDKKSRKWGAARWRLLKDAMTRPRRFLNFLKRKYCPDDSGDEFDEDDTYNDVEVQMILEFFKQFGLGYSDLPDVNTFAPELRGLLASRPKKPKGQGKQFEGNRRNNLKRDKEKEKKKKKLFANPLWDEEEEKKKAEAAAAADQLVPLLVPEDWPHVWDISATQRWLSKMMQEKKEKGKVFFRHWPIGMRCCSFLLCHLVPLKESLKLQCSEVWLCFNRWGAKVQRKLNETNQIQSTFCRSNGQMLPSICGLVVFCISRSWRKFQVRCPRADIFFFWRKSGATWQLRHFAAFAAFAVPAHVSQSPFDQFWCPKPTFWPCVARSHS